MPEWKRPLQKIEVGKGRIITEGEGIAILSVGQVGNYAVQAAKELNEIGLNPGVFDMRFVKPLDEELLAHIHANYSAIVTVEDGCLMGGFGSAILEFAADKGLQLPMKRLGIPDEIIEHGDQPQLHKECGYDVAEIKEAALLLSAPVSQEV